MTEGPFESFAMGNPKALVYLGGQRMTVEEAQRSPERLPFDLAPHERGMTADQLWTAAIADIKARRDRDGPSAWEQIRAEFDQFSLYELLKVRKFSRGAIEYYTMMNIVEADMNNAVMEVLREDLEGAYVDMQTIDGGMDRLPRAFYADLQQEVRFGAEVRAIDQTDADVIRGRNQLAGTPIAGRVVRFALFAPEQQTDLHAAIVSPEGRVHFAGEHCSLYHGWIQGALESGIRAAKEVHEAGAVA
jgi:monoamine oxidase